MNALQALTGQRSKWRYAVQLWRSHPEVAARPLQFAARLAAWRLFSWWPRGTTVNFKRYGVTFWCPPEWRGMSKMAFTLRDAYEPELAHLRRWVTSETVAVDVGAHYGAWTLPLASICNCVHAIEPSSHALGVLGRNLRLNLVANVYVHPVAVGAETSTLVLRMHDDRSRASLTFDSQEHAGAEVVDVLALDDLVSERVGFIKIDIEGYEFPALQGAARILDNDLPVVLFEVQNRAATRGGLDPHAAWNTLAARGSRFEQLELDGSWRPLAGPGDVRSPNVVAIPPGPSEATFADERK